jgi:LAO/AO transport system kinase
MSLLRHEGFWEPRVMTCSALHKQGIEAVWETIREYAAAARSQGALESARATQNLAWMRQLIDALLRDNLARHPKVKEAMPALEAAVRAAEQTPLAAAQAILALAREPV